MQSADEVRSQVEKLIGEDPTLTDPTKIFARVDKVGPVFRKRLRVTVEGKVASEREKQKIEQILNAHYHDSLVINNQVVVQAHQTHSAV